MRALWSGTISFGLVNIPIRVYSASEEKELSFHMLHKKDLSPVRFAKMCKRDGEEVPYNEIVKGYEYQKGEYVVVEEEDFVKANPKKTKTIEIQNFTLLDEVDTIYFSKPYYLEPDKGGSKAYKLLREALKRSKKVAVTEFVFHNKQHFGIVKAEGEVLVLYQLRYPSEIRSPDSLSLPKEEKVSDKEIKIALDLVEKQTETFNPKKYKDTYTEELQQVIDAKVKGKKPARKSKAPQATVSSDLMHLLQQSLTKSLNKKTPREEMRVPSTKKKSQIRRKSK